MERFGSRTWLSDVRLMPTVHSLSIVRVEKLERERGDQGADQVRHNVNPDLREINQFHHANRDRHGRIESAAGNGANGKCSHHHGETDGDCAVDVVANEAREVRVRCGVSTSLAFGGNDAALVMRAV